MSSEYGINKTNWVSNRNMYDYCMPHTPIYFVLSMVLFNIDSLLHCQFSQLEIGIVQ